MFTKEDVREFFSGVQDWEWGQLTSFDGLVDFAYSEMDEDALTQGHPDDLRNLMIYLYVEGAGECPGDYFSPDDLPLQFRI